MGGVVVDNYFFDFQFVDPFWRYSQSKVESCQKLRQILDVFLPSQILGGRASKNCTHVITPGLRHVVWIKICDDTPISPEVMDVHTLNFKLNFKFSPLNYLGGPPVPVGVCASKSWSIYSACKNLRAQHP